MLSCFFCRADINTLTTLLILLVFWGLAKFLFNLSSIPYSSFFTYPICLVISICCFRTTVIARVNFIAMLIAISSEAYWWATDYSNRPKIDYLIGVQTLIVLSRALLLNKVFLLYKYFSYGSGKIALDWQVRGLLLLDFILFTAMLIEYLVRHILGFSDILFVYNSFTPMATTLTAVMLCTIYMHYFYNQSQKYISV